MKTIHVAAAVIRRGDTIFATARGYGDWRGWWEFPGGKLEPGETAPEALRREIQEELDAEIRVGALLDTVEYDYPAFHVVLDCFWAELVGDGEPVLREAEDARWLTAETLEDVKWLPSDLAVLDKIRAALISSDSGEDKA